MPKRYTQALHKRVADVTSNIFERAVIEILGLKDKPKEEVTSAMIRLRQLHVWPHIRDYEQDMTKMLEIKEQVDIRYQELLTALPTKILEEIIFSHEQAKIRRMAKTLDAITSELARRSIFQDSNESDCRDENGDVDGTSAKIKADRSKSKKKRSNTNKS